MFSESGIGVSDSVETGSETAADKTDNVESDNYEQQQESFSDFNDDADNKELSESPEIKADKEGKFESQSGKVNNEPYKFADDSTRPEKFEHNSVPEYNSEYFDNGYKFRTENNQTRQEAGLDARVVRTEGQVKSEGSTERNVKAQRETPDKIRDDDGRAKDDAGHLHAHSQDGPNERGNLVAMDSQLNRHGEWRDMEKRCDSELEKGNSVYRSIDVHYPDDTTTRPDYFDVTCSVSDENGEHLYTFNDRIYNTDKESREEIYESGAKENTEATAQDTHTEEKTNENRKIAALFGNVEN